MRLVESRIQKFRNILDSEPIKFERDVTCLVGKNESGKTSVLHALFRLNPARAGARTTLSILEDYPAWLAKSDQRRGRLEDFRPITAAFELEPDDRAALEKRFGTNSVTTDVVHAYRTYGGDLIFDQPIDEATSVRNAVSRSGVSPEVAPSAHTAKTFKELSSAVTALQAKGDATATAAAAALEAPITEMLKGQPFATALAMAIDERLPKFFYFSDYSALPAQIKIRELLQKDKATLNEGEQTALALLTMAGAESENLLETEYEQRKRELENVANALTDQVLKYWSQNPDLRVTTDVTQVNISNAKGQQIAVVDELKVRIWDNRHLLSLPFDSRSSGFRWFFSFLASFSEFEFAEKKVVILLDEPALALHGRAQRDFLRFIDERLAEKHQVIYTTHSPFMIDPQQGKLQRVRVVEDRGRERGAKVSSDILTSDPDTLLPLMESLGYDLAQHLLVQPTNLVVEGTSDFTYLTILGDFLKSKGREGLDPRWSVVPLGGADMIPTFVALLGNRLDVSVLVDSRKAGHQKLSDLAAKGYLAKQRIITIGQILGQPMGEIEDLFDEADYLALYNAAFKKNVTAEDLKGTDSIVGKLARHQSVDRFDHGVPAEYFLRNRDKILHELRTTTLNNFAKLIGVINKTIDVPPPTKKMH